MDPVCLVYYPRVSNKSEVVPRAAGSKRAVGSQLPDTSLGTDVAVVVAAAVVAVAVAVAAVVDVAVAVAAAAVAVVVAVGELTEPGRLVIDARTSRHRVESAGCL